MQVETYEVTELNATGREQETDPAALEIIESLGLVGQKKLVAKTPEGIETRVPYRVMSTTEHRVYSLLLPDRVALKEYRGQMIPLRVLQVAAHAASLDHFKRIEVWHDEGKDDPLLVGSMSSYDFSRPDPRESFILARWGNVLQPFEELLIEAKRVVAATMKGAAQNAKIIAESILGDADIRAEVYLRTGNVPDSISFNPQR